MNLHTGLLEFLLLNSFFTFQSYSQVVISDSTPSTGRAFSIEDCVNEFSPAHVESTKVGYQYWFVGKEFIDGRTLKMSVVAPHKATHPPHRHQEDEFFFVLEGKAEFYLNGKTRDAGPYASFYCPSNSEHGIRNVGEAELKYLVIKKYEKRRSGE
jgi:mannose-6-phosphate isomerase-like protein (cupin superfamily)